jgi:hypothetical protein
MSAAGPQPIVLVTFYSCCGTTETLALQAAVGAVQARGLIRLRRLPDMDAARTRGAFPECLDTLARMHREYVPPAEADVLAADAIVVGAPAGASPSSPEWRDFLALIAHLGQDGRLAGKVAGVLDVGDAATVQAFASTLLTLGFTAPAPLPSAPAAGPGADRARALGRQVADTARALKQTAG